MKIRVALEFDGKAWRVNLPSYCIVDGSVLPVINGKTTPDGVLAGVSPDDPALRNLSVLVVVPEYTPLKDGQIDSEKMRDMYKKHPIFGKKEFAPAAILK